MSAEIEDQDFICNRKQIGHILIWQTCIIKYLCKFLSWKWKWKYKFYKVCLLLASLFKSPFCRFFILEVFWLQYAVVHSLIYGKCICALVVNVKSMRSDSRSCVVDGSLGRVWWQLVAWRGVAWRGGERECLAAGVSDGRDKSSLLLFIKGISRWWVMKLWAEFKGMKLTNNDTGRR